MIWFPFSNLTVLDPQRLAGVDDVAQDEDGVGRAQHDEELVEGVPHLGLEHDADGDEVAGEAEEGHHGGRHAVRPEAPAVQGLEKKQDL